LVISKKQNSKEVTKGKLPVFVDARVSISRGNGIGVSRNLSAGVNRKKSLRPSGISSETLTRFATLVNGKDFLSEKPFLPGFEIERYPARSVDPQY
jgi:hypothetical protein